MKTPNAIITILSLVAILAPVNADQINIVVNGDFETGQFDPFYEWNPAEEPLGNEPWTISTDNPHSGDYCLYRGLNHPSYMRQEIADGPMIGEILEYSFWARLASEPGDNVTAYTWLDYTDMQTGRTYMLLTYFPDLMQFDGQWMKLVPDMSHVDPNGIYRIDAITVAAYPSCAMYLDDVVLTVPEPASLAVLAIGAIGILIPRRSSRLPI